MYTCIYIYISFRSKMKLTVVIILIIFVIFTKTYYNQNENFIWSIAKPLRKEDTKHRQYFHRIQRRRRRRRNGGYEKIERRIKTTFLVGLLLLAGDVELNQGPWTCPRCDINFGRIRYRLDNHLAGQVKLTCDSCRRLFCSTSRRLEQHRRTEQTQHRLKHLYIHGCRSNSV